MPSINLSLVNVALNSFGLIVTVIIFSACLSEWIAQKRIVFKYFFFLLIYTMLALIGDTVAWLCEGNPELALWTLISNTVASCAGQMAMICFMEYLRNNLYQGSKAVTVTVKLFRVLCVASLCYAIGNAFFGYSFSVSPSGHYVHSENELMVVLHLLFSILSFAALIVMALCATKSTKSSRVAFLSYTLFPLAGIAIDYTYHGISLTYVGIVISIMVIYTSIYLQRQKMIDAQRNALMLSQINPHFTYNTLSAIAAMCDISPKQAKILTVDFARYLRRNLDSLTSENVIPFEKELEHVECYLKIEKTRFREKLNVIYSIDCKDFYIPPLSVQPIVENAVKHGITGRVEGGTLKISTFIRDERYVIEVIDDGVGFVTEDFEANRQGHVGIENVRSRIRSISRGTVSIKSTAGVGTRVSIEIPVEKGRKA